MLIYDGYKFRFYTEFNDNKELLRNEIQKRLRNNKLEEILK
jgi:ribosomal protein S17E